MKMRQHKPQECPGISQTLRLTPTTRDKVIAYVGQRFGLMRHAGDLTRAEARIEANVAKLPGLLRR